MLLRMFWFSISAKARTNRTEAAVSKKLKASLMFLVASSLPEAPSKKNETGSSRI